MDIPKNLQPVAKQGKIPVSTALILLLIETNSIRHNCSMNHILDLAKTQATMKS